MNVIFFFSFHAASLYNINNLTITYLSHFKYAEYSPFFCISNTKYISNIRLSFMTLKYFTSPVFLDSSMNNFGITKSSFLQFFHTSILVNRETYANQIFYNGTWLTKSSNFTNCIFVLNSNDKNFILNFGTNYLFDYCFFIDCDIKYFSLFVLIRTNITIRNSVFSNIKCTGKNSLISKSTDADCFAKIQFSNFTSNEIQDNLLCLTSINAEINNCIFNRNIDEKSLISLGNIQLSNQNILNDIIMTQNQLLASPASDISIKLTNVDDFARINGVFINDEKVQSDLLKYYHFSVNKINGTSICLSNCCLSNTREMWVNTDFIDDGNNSADEDCFKPNYQIVHYGIIGTETIELQVPNNILKYFENQE